MGVLVLKGLGVKNKSNIVCCLALRSMNAQTLTENWICLTGGPLTNEIGQLFLLIPP